MSTAICEHCGKDITYSIEFSTEHQMWCNWPDWCPSCRYDPLEKSQPHKMPRPYRPAIQLQFDFR